MRQFECVNPPVQYRGLVLLVLFVVIAAVVLVVAMLAQRDRRGDGAPPAPLVRDDADSDAMRILDKRFARGDIDAKEYQERRALLRQRPE